MQTITSKPVLSIHFGNDFRKPIYSFSNRYPQNRLINFLNVNPAKESEVINFCNKYKFIPRDIQKGFMFGFSQEHQEITEMAERLTKTKATDKDLVKIDKILNTRKIHTTYVDKSNVINNDQTLTNQNSKSNINIKFLMQSAQHKGTIVSLWEDLVKQAITNQKLKTCVNCHDFFILQSQHKRKYCDKPQCKNTYNKRRRRLIKNTHEN